jgi:hypothetical protein
MTLLPIVLLLSQLVTISRVAAVRLLTLAVAFPLLMLAVSPLVALGLHLSGLPNGGSDYRAVAQTVERVWRAHIDQPLRIVGSTTSVNGIVFYFEDPPSTIDIDNPKLTPWVSVDRVRREGAAIVCPETDTFCVRAPWLRRVLSSRRRRERGGVAPLFRIRVAARALRDPRHCAGLTSGYAQRYNAGTLTLYLRRGLIVALTSRSSGGSGVR